MGSDLRLVVEGDPVVDEERLSTMDPLLESKGVAVEVRCKFAVNPFSGDVSAWKQWSFRARVHESAWDLTWISGRQRCLRPAELHCLEHLLEEGALHHRRKRGGDARRCGRRRSCSGGGGDRQACQSHCRICEGHRKLEREKTRRSSGARGGLLLVHFEVT